MIKKSLAAILAVIMLLSLCACKSDGSGAAIKYPIDEEPVSLDPQIAEGQSAKMAVLNGFEGLVRYDSEGKIVPGVAESWSYDPSSMTYTFKLRKDTNWRLMNDFAPMFDCEDVEELEKKFDKRVTAKDFVFGFRRAVSPDTQAPEASSLYIIKNAKSINNGKMDESTLGVKAVGDYELKITLESDKMSEQQFLSLLTRSISMPCNEKFFKATKGRYGLDYTTTLCNGPFYFKYWTREASLTFKKNEDYKGHSEVMPAGVTFFVSKDKEERKQNLVEGVYIAAPLGTIPFEDKDFTVTKNYDTVWSLSFNCNDESLKNAEIRRALCGSVDAQHIVPEGEDLLKTFSIIPPSCIVAGADMDSVPVTVQKYDPARANERWNKALEKLDKKRVTLTLICIQEHEKAMQNLIQDWQETFGLGINISVEVLQKEEIDERIAKGDYQIALVPITANSKSASEFLTTLKSNGMNNIFNGNDKKFDSLVDNLHSYLGTELLKQVRNAEKHFLLSGTALPVFASPSFYAVSKGVSGLYIDSETAAVGFVSATVED